jgi:hypothetical protein
MVALTIKDNFPDVQRYLKARHKQATFATAVALTRTAQDVRQAEYAEMRRVFDRPTPYTMRSLFVKPATKAKLESRVWVKDDRAGSGTPAERYLLPQIEGGPRRAKGFELALQRAGYMPQGYRAVPGEFARLDRFGNVSYGQLIEIMSQLRITLTSGHTRNISTDKKKAARARRRAGGQYVAFPEGRGTLRPGIYQRRDFAMGSAAPRAVLIFVRQTSYRPRFRFEAVAQRTLHRVFPAHFARAYREALATAR